MATHTISIVPPAADPAVEDAVELNCAADGALVRIPPESGRTWHIVAADVQACSRLAREAMMSRAVERVPGSGGLLSAASVLENIVLPAVYHGRIGGGRLAESVYEACAACAMDRSQADALCERPVARLDGFEQRLVCLLRALVMRPAVLLFERVFEGLPLREMEQVAQFPGYYRRVVARGTVIFLDVAGMPHAEIAADVRIDTARERQRIDTENT